MHKWIFVGAVCAVALGACEPTPPIELDYGNVYRITAKPPIYPSPARPTEKLWFGCPEPELYRRIVRKEARYDYYRCRTFEPGEPVYMLSPSGSQFRLSSRVRIRRAAPRIVSTLEEMEALKAANKPLDFMTLEEMDATAFYSEPGSRWGWVYISVDALQIADGKD